MKKLVDVFVNLFELIDVVVDFVINLDIDILIIYNMMFMY